MEELIRFKNVKKEYNIGEKTFNALDGVDFTVNKGEFVVILGPSGALDSKTGVEVLKLLKKQCDSNNGKNTVIIVTHNNLIADIADTVIHVKNGNIKNIIHNENPKSIDEIQW